MSFWRLRAVPRRPCVESRPLSPLASPPAPAPPAPHAASSTLSLRPSTPPPPLCPSRPRPRPLVDEDDDRCCLGSGRCGVAALACAGSSCGCAGGEVELGPGGADAAGGVVVGERGGLGGGEGAEPDADALDGVVDLGRTLAPRPAPHAPVLRRLPAAPDRGQENKTLAAEAHRLEGLFSQARDDVATAEHAAATTEGEVASLRAEVERLQALLDRKKDDREADERQRQGLEAELEAVRQAKLKLEEEIDALKTSAATTVDERETAPVAGAPKEDALAWQGLAASAAAGAAVTAAVVLIYLRLKRIWNESLSSAKRNLEEIDDECQDTTDDNDDANQQKKVKKMRGQGRAKH